MPSYYIKHITYNGDVDDDIVVAEDYNVLDDDRRVGGDIILMIYWRY